MAPRADSRSGSSASENSAMSVMSNDIGGGGVSTRSVPLRLLSAAVGSLTLSHWTPTVEDPLDNIVHLLISDTDVCDGGRSHTVVYLYCDVLQDVIR